MYELKSDTDQTLSVFLNDYVEERLDPVECLAFEECLACDSQLSSLARKSKAGKRALNNAFQVTAADDFEEKLARRIAIERAEIIIKEERHNGVETVS